MQIQPPNPVKKTESWTFAGPIGKRLPVTEIRKAMAGKTYRLSNRQTVKQAAVFPLPVQTSGNIQ